MSRKVKQGYIGAGLCIIAAIAFAASISASLQSEYDESMRRIENLAEVLTYLESDGQITIHATDDFRHEVDRYESDAQYLAWFMYGRLGKSRAEQILPDLYLGIALCAALASLVYFVLAVRGNRETTTTRTVDHDLP